MTMRRDVLVALTAPSLVLRPDLSHDVICGIQTQELNSVIEGR